MASKNIVKVYELSKSTKEIKSIRMFQADQEILNHFYDLRSNIITLFSRRMINNLFWKGM